MPAQNYGALGMTFTVVRALQCVSLISIIGMTANFVAEMVAANTVAPSVVVGTLVVVGLNTCAFLQTFKLIFIIVLCSSPLLCGNIHSVLGQHPSFPHKHRHGLSPPHRRHRCSSHHRQTLVIPQLHGHSQRLQCHYGRRYRLIEEQLEQD
jgi:hypothetical protein